MEKENVKVHNASCLSLQGFRDLEAFFKKVGWNPTYIEDGYTETEGDNEDFVYENPIVQWLVDHDEIITSIVMVVEIFAIGYFLWRVSH